MYYNKYGAYLKSIKHTGESCTATLRAADEYIKKSQKKHKKKGGDVSLVPISYTVDRRIFNSLDATANF